MQLNNGARALQCRSEVFVLVLVFDFIAFICIYVLIWKQLFHSYRLCFEWFYIGTLDLKREIKKKLPTSSFFFIEVTLLFPSLGHP